VARKPPIPRSGCAPVGGTPYAIVALLFVGAANFRHAIAGMLFLGHRAAAILQLFRAHAVVVAAARTIAPVPSSAC